MVGRRTLERPNQNQKRAKAVATAAIDALGPNGFLHLSAFLEPMEALRLSRTSRTVHEAMDDSMWRAMLLHRCGVKPSLLKPRTQTREMVATLSHKKSCAHCDRFEVDGCRAIKVHTEHRGKKLCPTCFELPRFKEISHMDTVVTYVELRELRYRVVTTGDYEMGELYRKRMYNLQAVLDLAARRRSSSAT
ncbi:hypothetical protein SPRG_09450 [Saprolegnia parasitica CBS 223.65]|uniref:F-box domain-containing protein n=1 Tax=Saprolegnia parasitica (strain CBS 223.65) TaxID=695850 RepID=A0A067C7S7_SAPPC|nr:hypothetical protein SPRG_09450 [Saprolegnia parasitica CBS 223.65]KDO25175.1 hypothetical protein SPRG_09450 [Saprolegnia parasitica CBS 223.65]|eukprot:XP_012204041.1 hypothetical protein SPRG_09450 [Saprolegnia parasitica CBS 223.65]